MQEQDRWAQEASVLWPIHPTLAAPSQGSLLPEKCCGISRTSSQRQWEKAWMTLGYAAAAELCDEGREYMANKEKAKESCTGTKEDKASSLVPERLLSCHPFLHSPLLILFHFISL